MMRKAKAKEPRAIVYRFAVRRPRKNPKARPVGNVISANKKEAVAFLSRLYGAAPGDVTVTRRFSYVPARAKAGEGRR